MNKTFIKLVIMAAFLMIILTGCVSKIDTTVVLNDDFSGKRVITCTVSRQKIRTDVNGGESALDSFIKINCPSQLTYEKIENRYNITYNFVLSFNNREEYIDKVEKILGKKPMIVFASPNSPFSKGFILQEDFSSRDLLNWFENIGAEKEILLTKGEFFTENSTVVDYKGNTIPTQQLVDIRNIDYLRIDKISILTEILQGGALKRNVKFEVPNVRFEGNSQKIIDYMKSRVPDGGTFEIKDISDGKMFVIEFESSDSIDLSNKMQKLLDNNDNIVNLHSEKSEFFGDKNIFNEHLNLCSFISDYSGKVYLEYEVISEDGSEISNAEVMSSGVWSRSVGYKSSKNFLYFGDSSVFETRIMTHNEFVIKNISVSMNQLYDDSFKREIYFTFDNSKGLNQTEKLEKYLNSLKPRFAIIENEGEILKVTINGSAEEISLDLYTLFGDNNFVKLKTDYGFKLFEKTNLEDQIDFRNIINIMGVYNSPVIYSYTSNKNIDNISHRESENINIPNSYNEYGDLLLSPSTVNNVSAECSKVNVFFIVICSIGAIISIALFAVVLFKIIYLLKKHVTVIGKDGKKEVIEFLDEYCPTCGARVYKGSSYCRVCGSIVGTIVEVSSKE